MFLFIASVISFDYCPYSSIDIELDEHGFRAICDKTYYILYTKSSYRQIIFEGGDIRIQIGNNNPANIIYVFPTIFSKNSINIIFLDYQNATEIEKYATIYGNRTNLMIFISNKCIWDLDSYSNYNKKYQISKYWKKECFGHLSFYSYLSYDSKNDIANVHYIKKGAFIGIVFAIVISILFIVISTYLIGLYRYKKVNKQKSESCDNV